METTKHHSKQNPDVLWTSTDQRRLQVHQQHCLMFRIPVRDGWKPDSPENNQRTQMLEKWTLYSHRQSGFRRHFARLDWHTHQCL